MYLGLCKICRFPRSQRWTNCQRWQPRPRQICWLQTHSVQRDVDWVLVIVDDEEDGDVDADGEGDQTQNTCGMIFKSC